MAEKNGSSGAERVVSGAAWREFCAKLAEAGEVILAADVPATALDGVPATPWST